METVRYSKVDPEIKTKWVEALRSGKFKQGEGYLNQDGCNCCLGVLAEINGLPTAPGYDGRPNIKRYIFGEDDVSGYQPPVGYCGLDYNTLSTLVHKNDGIMGSNKYTFEQIADFIEQEL